MPLCTTCLRLVDDADSLETKFRSKLSELRAALLAGRDKQTWPLQTRRPPIEDPCYFETVSCSSSTVLGEDVKVEAGGLDQRDAASQQAPFTQASQSSLETCSIENISCSQDEATIPVRYSSDDERSLEVAPTAANSDHRRRKRLVKTENKAESWSKRSKKKKKAGPDSARGSSGPGRNSTDGGVDEDPLAFRDNEGSSKVWSTKLYKIECTCADRKTVGKLRGAIGAIR